MQIVKKKEYILPIIFIIGSIAFYLAMNLYEGESYRLVHYLSIVYCFVFVLVSVLIKKKNYFFILAMFFTALADFFLVLPEAPNQTPGMLFFSIVQIVYFVILLLNESKKLRIVNITIRAFLIIVVQIVTVLVLKENADFVSLVSMFYYTNLILNLIFSFFEIKTNYYLVIGFFFFLLCDSIIGLQTINGLCFTLQEGTFLYNILFSSSVDFVWLFYFPSQVFLSLAATNCFRTNKKEPLK